MLVRKARSAPERLLQASAAVSAALAGAEGVAAVEAGLGSVLSGLRSQAMLVAIACGTGPFGHSPVAGDCRVTARESVRYIDGPSVRINPVFEFQF